MSKVDIKARKNNNNKWRFGDDSVKTFQRFFLFFIFLVKEDLSKIRQEKLRLKCSPKSQKLNQYLVFCAKIIKIYPGEQNRVQDLIFGLSSDFQKKNPEIQSSTD